MISSCKTHGLYMTETCELCVPEPDPDEVVIIGGADPGKQNDSFAYSEVRVEKGIAYLHSPPKQWLHTNYPEIVDKLAQRFFAAKLRLLAVDSTGAGQVVVDYFIKAGVRTFDLNYGKKVAPVWVNEVSDEAKLSPIKHEMIQFYRLCAYQNKIKLLDPSRYPTVSELIKELKEQELIEGADPEHHEDAKVKYGHPSNTHDDSAWAYLMALYVARPWIEHGGVRTSFMRPPDYNPNRYVR